MGAATHTGATTIESGVSLLLAGPGTPLAASTSAFRIASGGTFNLVGRNATIGSLADVAGAGGVVINSGLLPAVLTIGNDNTSTSFSGTLEDGFLGTLRLTKIGTGTQTLSGTNTYTGATTVNAGGLIVNGSIASSRGLTVNAGATVGGTGTLPSTTINGGTLSPGNSIGTITINGNLVFGAGSVYRVDVSPSAADRTNVTGSATLAGTAQLAFTPGSSTSNINYTILSAAGGRSGTFDHGDEACHPALSAKLSYTPTDRAVDAQFAGRGRDHRHAEPGGGRGRARRGLQRGPADRSRHCIGLSAPRLPAALDQLSGEVHASTAGVLMDESRYMRNAVLGRLRQASYGGDTRMAALSFGGPQTAFQDGEAGNVLAYAKSPCPVKAPPRAPAPSHDVVFWTQGFGAWGRFDSRRQCRECAARSRGLHHRRRHARRRERARRNRGRLHRLAQQNSMVAVAPTSRPAHLAAYGGWSFGAFNLRGRRRLRVARRSIPSRTIAFPGLFDRATRAV